jgi:hypothetical protein
MLEAGHRFVYNLAVDDFDVIVLTELVEVGDGRDFASRVGHRARV